MLVAYLEPRIQPDCHSLDRHPAAQKGLKWFLVHPHKSTRAVICSPRLVTEVTNTSFRHDWRALRQAIHMLSKGEQSH